MKSEAPGATTSLIEVTHIDARGLWLYVDGKEHHLPYQHFPWFVDATLRQICHVERHSEDHFHWPDLDVDLTLDMIDFPEKYPLKYKGVTVKARPTRTGIQARRQPEATAYSRTHASKSAITEGARCRSAITGRFVTHKYADRHPKTTVKEKVKPGRKKR